MTEMKMRVMLNRVWMSSYGDGSTFSVVVKNAEERNVVRALESSGYVRDVMPLVNGKRMTGKITDLGRDYFRKEFGPPPIRR